LWRAMAKVAYLETIVRVRERSNKALATSNKVLIANNTLFHDKKRHDKTNWANDKRLQQQAT
jgi:hypothetical protein